MAAPPRQRTPPPAAGDQPPYDLEAERITLGSCIGVRDSVIALADWLFPEYFFVEAHATIYRAILACYNRRVPPDLMTVRNELRAMGMLDAIGGVGYLVQLTSAATAEGVTDVHVVFYAKPIETAALLRAVASAGTEAVRQALASGADPEAVVSEAVAKLHEVVQKKQATGFVAMEDIVDGWFARLQAMMVSGDPALGLKTGFTDLDKLTGGLQKSDLLILAARPASGKTSLALNIAYHAALHEEARVGIFSLEMSKDQLMQRMLATHTGVDMQKLRTGQIRDSDLQVLTEALGVLSKLPIYIDDTPGVTPMDVRAKCRRLKADHGLDLVIIDYLQLMTGSYRRDGNRVQEVSEISRGVKALAREMDIPVIALSQLSRAVESRTDNVPKLADLRESGSLEQDADIVMFIYREEMYDPETDKKGVAELHLRKHRNGPEGVVPLRFFKSTTRFANLETYRQPEGYDSPPAAKPRTTPPPATDAWLPGWDREDYYADG